MPRVTFSHSKVNPPHLTIDTGADEIKWSYGLNTVVYPTYGGEVVQILSVFIEDLTVSGTVKHYSSNGNYSRPGLEEIYKWFLQYIQLASQQGEFVQEPVVFRYPHRGWEMKIIPKALPGFQYGREVVAPKYRVVSAVHEDDPLVRDLTMKNAEFKRFLVGGSTLEGAGAFGELSADIGYSEDNPFSDPLASQTQFNPNMEPHIADWFNKLIPSYLQHNFDAIAGDFGSKPLFLKKNSYQSEATRIEKLHQLKDSIHKGKK